MTGCCNIVDSVLRNASKKERRAAAAITKNAWETELSGHHKRLGQGQIAAHDGKTRSAAKRRIRLA